MAASLDYLILGVLHENVGFLAEEPGPLVWQPSHVHLVDGLLPAALRLLGFRLEKKQGPSMRSLKKVALKRVTY